MKSIVSQWRGATGYQKFELAASMSIVISVSIIAVFAIARLALSVTQMLILNMDFLDPAVFQTLFGMIFIVLISLEFNKSILQSLTEDSSLVQIKGIVLIAVMVVVRKIIVLDIKDTSFELLLGLSSILISLGALYFFISRGSKSA